MSGGCFFGCDFESQQVGPEGGQQRFADEDPERHPERFRGDVMLSQQRGQPRTDQHEGVKDDSRVQCPPRTIQRVRLHTNRGSMITHLRASLRSDLRNVRLNLSEVVVDQILEGLTLRHRLATIENSVVDSYEHAVLFGSHFVLSFS